MRQGGEAGAQLAQRLGIRPCMQPHSVEQLLLELGAPAEPTSAEAAAAYSGSGSRWAAGGKVGAGAEEQLAYQVVAGLLSPAAHDVLGDLCKGGGGE